MNPSTPRNEVPSRTYDFPGQLSLEARGSEMLFPYVHLGTTAVIYPPPPKYLLVITFSSHDRGKKIRAPATSVPEGIKEKSRALNRGIDVRLLRYRVHGRRDTGFSLLGHRQSR